MSLVSAFGRDLLPMALDTRRSTTGYIYPYSTEFKRIELESFNGTPLMGVIGIY
ncbi:MAG: hypothetical protein SWK76_12525 [Actinomycetota bacterium]|nr:hypothetical protein [Actinomycetota bacterium]